MKMNHLTLDRLDRELSSLVRNIATEKHLFLSDVMRRCTMTDMWTLASKAGALAWLYDAPQNLAEAIEVLFAFEGKLQTIADWR